MSKEPKLTEGEKKRNLTDKLDKAKQHQPLITKIPQVRENDFLDNELQSNLFLGPSSN